GGGGGLLGGRTGAGTQGYLGPFRILEAGRNSPREPGRKLVEPVQIEEYSAVNPHEVRITKPLFQLRNGPIHAVGLAFDGSESKPPLAEEVSNARNIEEARTLTHADRNSFQGCPCRIAQCSR